MVAGARASETERTDGFVRDPFAARLAGERGVAILRALPHPEVMGFGIGIRSRFLDELVLQAIQAGGISTVACLGAGLDTRPWRLDLPEHLKWIEVDFTDMLDYKEECMRGEQPRCRRERLSADLNDPAQRAGVFAAVGHAPALLITEGLLMYLPGATVNAVAAESRSQSGIAYWLLDVTTAAFTAAIGGGGSSALRHVQADDHLQGEQILDTLRQHGWTGAEHRSYIRDLDFAADRIRRMSERRPEGMQPPVFAPDEPSGVHLLRCA
jgi:methyltransferase (TIGR00027 family)